MAAEFDHAGARVEASGTGNGGKACVDIGRRRLDNRAAGIADQKDRLGMGAMPARTGEEGAAALDAMDEIIGHEKIQRPVDRDWRYSLSAGRLQPLDQIIGTNRSTCPQKRLEHSGALLRQLPAPP